MTGPFQGYTSSVESVVYSPDGRHIVSGSEDSTIVVWDATTDKAVAGPFQGHTDCVCLLSILLMEDTLFLALGTRPLGFGIQPLARQVYFGDTQIVLSLLYILLMEGVLLLALMIASGFGTQSLAMS